MIKNGDDIMDSVKLKRILSVVAGIVLIIIFLYNSGLFGGKTEADNSDPTQSQNSVVQDSDNGQGSTGSQPTQTEGSTGNTDQSNATAQPNGTEPSGNAATELAGNAEPSDNIETELTGNTDPAANTDQTGTDGSSTYVSYRFRSDKLLTQHYEKHGIEMGFDSKESYEKAASDVINNPAALYKLEAEDGDHVYYVEETNEFAILSPDGYIRTYFLPSAGKAYFDRQ